MTDFDLDKTSELESLFEVPRPERDEKWFESFFENVVEACMASSAEQVAVGPDGFPYFELHIPPREKEFDPFSVAHILEHCTDNGIGCVICPSEKGPQWVFSYGMLWSLRETSTFDARKDLGVDFSISSEAESMFASPSSAVLPPYARNVVKNFLSAYGVEDVGVIMQIPSTHPANISLIFSIFKEDFPDEGDFKDIMSRLALWYLPAHIGLLGVDKQSGLEFVPL